MKTEHGIDYLTTMKRQFWGSAVLLFINALTFLFMPSAAETLESGLGRDNVITVGIMFWISILTGYGLLAAANHNRKEFAARYLNGDLQMGQPRPGILTFFSNTPALIADAVMIAAAVLFLIQLLQGMTAKFITYLILAILSFSVNMHGMFNGRIFKATKNQLRRREESNA